MLGACKDRKGLATRGSQGAIRPIYIQGLGGAHEPPSSINDIHSLHIYPYDKDAKKPNLLF